MQISSAVGLIITEPVKLVHKAFVAKAFDVFVGHTVIALAVPARVKEANVLREVSVKLVKPLVRGQYGEVPAAPRPFFSFLR